MYDINERDDEYASVLVGLAAIILVWLAMLAGSTFVVVATLKALGVL